MAVIVFDLFLASKGFISEALISSNQYLMLLWIELGYSSLASMPNKLLLETK